MNTREQLLGLAKDLRLRGTWGTPGEHGLTARVTGTVLDNTIGDAPGHGELVVHLEYAGNEVTVNLASLLADYCGMAQAEAKKATP